VGKLDDVIKNVGHHPDASLVTISDDQQLFVDSNKSSIIDSQPDSDSSINPTQTFAHDHKKVNRSNITTSNCLHDDAQTISHFNVHPNIESCRSKTIVDEEFKKLRTNLIYMMEKKDLKTFLFSSSRHAEGKTTTVLSLARCFGEISNLKTCVIDADFRRPRLKNFYDLDVKTGIDDVLIKGSDLKDALIYSKRDNVYVLPTRKGHSNASELLGLDKMRTIVKILKEDFDLVLIDSSPCISTTDPFIIGSFVDAVSLIVKMRHTPKESVEYTINLLRQKEIPFIGLILTHHRGGYHSYLLQRYNYYSDYGYDSYKSDQ